uniref:Arf-GAP with Rho-GAP domain, ANK repeat and PH domain-containing protein 2 n=1 Tax=Gouania willdenowi TaxID=441366 RepID=A0A8C5N3K7_GOUWI
MLEPPEPSPDLADWLSTLRLTQYVFHFHNGGYTCLEDCKGLTEQCLLELKILPTGHRRRILRSLEALGLQPQSEEEDGDVKEGVESRSSRNKLTLPPRARLGAELEDDYLSNPQTTPRDSQNIQTSITHYSLPASVHSSSISESLSDAETPSDLETSLEDPVVPSISPVLSPAEVLLPLKSEDNDGFPCEMVENSLYDAISSFKSRAGPRSTRSYRLRHRPVPEIPNQSVAQLQDRKKSQKEKKIKTLPVLNVQDSYEDEYSTVEECARILPLASTDPSFSSLPDTTVPMGPVASGPKGGSLNIVECDLYSEATDAMGVAMEISPYACFYSAPKHQVLKVGWLEKLSPQGNCVFQRRWVRFDGQSFAYYNSDKEMYSKGMILASAMKHVRGLGENKFEVVTSLRTFVFRADGEGERQEWIETLLTAKHPPVGGSHKAPDSRPHPSSTNKRGLLELRGYKGKALVSLAGSKVRLCKSEQDFRAGLAITEVELTAANIRDVDRRGFEINTPFKNFCFTAESEREKEEWIEAVQESIAETLYDYEVAEKIWFNEANRTCADCHSPKPEWASVNLGVVICKKCAGQHRSLGPNISKVRSLKLDSSIWSNELVQLFLAIGNKNANHFWAANLPLEEDIFSGASAEQRATFIRRKYRERKYRKVLEDFQDLEQLNKALCAAVVSPEVLQTVTLVFSGANVMCATGDPTYSTPYLLAQHAGQKLQMEFLHQNKLSGDSPLRPLCFSDLVIVSFTDLTRRWCTLEGGFLSYYESERSPSAIERVILQNANFGLCNCCRAVFTAELCLQTERVLIVGAETQETLHDWIQALTKCFIPSKVEGLVQKDSELIGRLYYKEGHDLYHWRLGWFMLEASTLHFSSGEEEGEGGVLQLKQLQELTVSTHTEGEDKIQVLLMVESGRTVYIHGFNKTDFTLWHSAIAMAAGTDGKALCDQQLTRNGVPIIVDSCIAFVTQYGLCQEGVYQNPGDSNRVSLLLEEFTRDARNVKLREKEHQVEDVTDTLKSFLSQAEDALLTKELYPYWVSALDEKDVTQRVKKYITYIESLPKTNQSTLHALLQHLYRYQCSHFNHMPTEKLASAFSSCLFQTRGETPQETHVVQDLIDNYITIFSVSKEVSLSLFSPAGDLIFEVYLEKKEPETCCLIKVSPSMRPVELAETTLKMRNIAFNTEDFWTTFEVIENGELERPLHNSEKILEQVLEWSTLDNPSSAFLVIKKFTAKQFINGAFLKFSDGSSKRLSGHKFQDKYVVLHAEKLLLYRDIKVSPLWSQA